MMYDPENSSLLMPIKGQSQAECCQATPDRLTIVFPLDGDYETIIGEEGSSLEQGFSVAFESDLRDMFGITGEINILNIKRGSLIVTVDILRDTEGRLITRDEIIRDFTAGKDLPKSGVKIKSTPSFQAYDPASEYFFWSESLGRGFHGEEIGVGVGVFLLVLCIGCVMLIVAAK